MTYTTTLVSLIARTPIVSMQLRHTLTRLRKSVLWQLLREVIILQPLTLTRLQKSGLWRRVKEATILQQDIRTANTRRLLTLTQLQRLALWQLLKEAIIPQRGIHTANTLQQPTLLTLLQVPIRLSRFSISNCLMGLTNYQWRMRSLYQPKCITTCFPLRTTENYP